MLKVRYETETLKMTGWCAFEKNWDELVAGEGEAIVWLENYDGVAPMETDFYYLNETLDAIIVNPDYVPPVTLESFVPLDLSQSIEARVTHLLQYLIRCSEILFRE